MGWTALPASGYFVEFLKRPTKTPRHLFCGEHTFPGAWCPNCSKPLLRFLTLDLTAPEFGLGKSHGRVSLAYCWRCDVAQRELYYRCSPAGDISLVSWGRGGPSPDFPYDDYPLAFPGRPIRLVSISRRTQRLFGMANAGKLSRTYSDEGGFPEFEDEPPDLCDDTTMAGTEPRHQVGGQPLLLDTYWRMRCPSCRQRMPFLASIGDDSGSERGFTGNPFVQVLYHYCRRCHCVGAYHQTD